MFNASNIGMQYVTGTFITFTTLLDTCLSSLQYGNEEWVSVISYLLCAYVGILEDTLEIASFYRSASSL